MTAVTNFLRLVADQPPFWQGAIAAVTLVGAAIVVSAFVEVLVLGLPWLRRALTEQTDGVRRVRIDSPEAHAIERRERIAAGKCPAGPIVPMTGERR